MSRKAAGITKRDNGTLMSRFTVNGKRYTVYGKTVKECRDKEIEKRRQIAEGVNERGATMSLDKYFEYWIEGKAGTVKGTTIRTQRILYRNISAASIGKTGKRFGSFKLSQIEVKDVKELQTVLNETLTTRTTNDSVSLLSSILKTAIDERILQWNPAKAVRSLQRTEPKAADTIHRALTMEETANFIRAAQDAGSWYCNLYIFLLHTGVRIGEAGALTPADVSAQVVRIHRTITRTEIGGYEIGTDTKTAAGNRVIPLDNEALKAVAAQRRNERLLRGKGGKVTDISEMSEPIFKTPRGTLLRSSLVNTDIKRICKRSGIDVFTIHALRDTFATRCVESGMDVKQLQSIMGHTNIAMTLGLYAHANEERKAQQIQAVNFM